jgi:hypothetical protein
MFIVYYIIRTYAHALLCYVYVCVFLKCSACLRRAYDVRVDTFTREEIENWQCPACMDKCVCAACIRKTEVAQQSTQKAAALAAFYSGNGSQTHPAAFAAMQFQMHMAAAAAFSHLTLDQRNALATVSGAAAAPPPAVPVPAIVPTVTPSGVPTVESPFVHAQEATTLASTNDVPHAAMMAALPTIPQSVNSTQPITTSLPPQPPPNPLVPTPLPATSDTALPPATTLGISSSMRSSQRAFSCPSSPVHKSNSAAFNYPGHFSRPQQEHTGVSDPTLPTLPKHQMELMHGSSIPREELDSSLDVRSQPMKYEGQVEAAGPLRHRRNSVKVTPMGRVKSRPQSHQSSRASSPTRQGVGGESVFAPSTSWTQEQLTELRNTHPELQLHVDFSNALMLDDGRQQQTWEKQHVKPRRQHQRSAPASPRGRKRGTVNAKQQSRHAVPAVDLSVHPSSIHNGQTAVCFENDRIVMPPFHPQPQQAQQHQQSQAQESEQPQSFISSNPTYGLTHQQLQQQMHQQHLLQGQFNSQLSSPANQPPIGMAIGMSPQHGSMMSPSYVSPQNHASMLSSYLQQQTGTYISPTNQNGLIPDFDLMQQQHQQMHMQQDSHISPGMAMHHFMQHQSHPVHPSGMQSFFPTDMSLDAIQQLQQTVQSVIDSKTHQQQQHQTQHEQESMQSGLPPTNSELEFDPFSTQDLTASAAHNPDSFGSEHGHAPMHPSTFSFNAVGQSPTQQQLMMKHHTPLPFLSVDEDARSPTHPSSIPRMQTHGSVPFPIPSPPFSNTSAGTLAPLSSAAAASFTSNMSPLGTTVLSPPNMIAQSIRDNSTITHDV